MDGAAVVANANIIFMIPMFLVWEREEPCCGVGGNLMAEYLAEKSAGLLAGFCFGLYKDTR
jgi:hypothetical protein